MRIAKSMQKPNGSSLIRRMRLDGLLRGAAVVLFTLSLTVVAAQEASDAGILVQQFRNGDAATKAVVLNEIADQPATEVASVYAAALDYALDSLGEVGTDARFRELALQTVRRLGEARHSAAIDDLWQLFLSYSDNTVRIAVLDVLAEIASGDAETVTSINEWLLAQNALAESDRSVDTQVVHAAVDAAARMGDASSFVPLADTAIAAHSRKISSRAEEALTDVATKDGIVEAVTSATSAELLARVSYLIGLASLSEDLRAEIAAAALEHAARTVVADASDRTALRRTRSICATYLTAMEYSPATSAVISHFNRTVAEYRNKTVTRSALIEAIRAVGAMDTEAAALRLSDYLELANTYTEYDRPFDTRLVLETLSALGGIGSDAAYDDIYYVTLLDYPNVVTDAAREALEQLAR